MTVQFRLLDAAALGYARQLQEYTTEMVNFVPCFLLISD